jgi:GTP-binding protein YchF
MALNLGIVGLPNVGKSTLFNALSATQAAASANYPFCTIEPNVGAVPVPDKRLDALAAIVKPQNILPTTVDFVDIAGLVRGASKGEGLGNQFLGNIRATDAIVHVVRCFVDENVIHVEGGVDPLRDIAIIDTELLLKDLDTVDKRISRVEKGAKTDPKLRPELDMLTALRASLDDGRPARAFAVPEAEDANFKALFLLTAKPVLYACNVEESSVATGNALSERVKAHAAAEGSRSVVISAAIEAEISVLEEAERADFLASLGLTESGLDRLIREGYGLLGLSTYFTAGEKEVRAWTIRKGMKAPQAAGVIHSDFERGFIRAEVIAYADYVALGGEAGARSAGKLRVEGKEYVVQDGDVMHFRFNV